MKQEMIDQAMRAAVGHHQNGRWREAGEIYRQVLAHFPNHPEPLHLLGLLTSDAGQVDEAVAMIRRAIEINPGNALYHSNLGAVFRAHGRLDEAIVAFNRALEIRPQWPQAHSHLGNALRDAGRHHEAIAVYRKALQLDPEFAVAHSNLGSALQDMGELDQAVEAFRQALRLQPNYAAAYRNLGNALNTRGNLQEAIQCLQKGVSLAPEDATLHSALLFSLAHHPDYDQAEIDRESRNWALRHAGRIPVEYAAFLNDISPNRRLKIAYVSKYFCDSAEFHYILPVIASHDHERFEVFLYSDVIRDDPLTALVRKLADHWHGIVGLSDVRVAQLMREHCIDIAVMIGHHSPGNRLLAMARKTAPLQLTWLFSAASTGLDTINYRISDPHIDPPGSDDSCYSERTIRLPQTAWCYDPLVRGLAVNPPPAIQNGYITFGSLNRAWKINDAVIAMWARVLNAVADARLCLLAAPGGARQRVLDSFTSFQIDADRIRFVARQPRWRYLQTYHQIDIVLDTFPYNGHTTSLDALWMGVPVVTLAHRRPVGRVGASLLSNLGLAELIAETPEAFVATATQLARDLPRLSALRAGLRQRMEASPLMNPRGFTKNLEAAYRQIWREWCQMQPVAK